MAGWTDIVDSAVTNTLNIAKLGYSIYQDQRNSAFSRDQFDYQKALNQQIMDREDTAIQRRVADAEAAGISKYAVAGQGASASALSTFGGSMGSQKLDGSRFDVINAVLQTQEQAARTKLAQAEYKFYKDTANERKDKISLENLAIGASTKRTNSETAGIDLENLFRSRKNLLDQNEYDFWSGNDFANFRQRLANDLLGSDYDTNIKGLDWLIRSTFDYDRARRNDDRDRNDFTLSKERFDWLTAQGKDGIDNFVKGLMSEYLKNAADANIKSKEDKGWTAEHGMKFGGDWIKNIFVPLMLLFMK